MFRKVLVCIGHCIYWTVLDVLDSVFKGQWLYVLEKMEIEHNLLQRE